MTHFTFGYLRNFSKIGLIGGFLLPLQLLAAGNDSTGNSQMPCTMKVEGSVQTQVESYDRYANRRSDKPILPQNIQKSIDSKGYSLSDTTSGFLVQISYNYAPHYSSSETDKASLSFNLINSSGETIWKKLAVGEITCETVPDESTNVGAFSRFLVWLNRCDGDNHDPQEFARLRAEALVTKYFKAMPSCKSAKLLKAIKER